MQYKNIDFLFSTDCNMACKYCYIKKDKKEMSLYNFKTREKILNGELKQNIINNLGKTHLNEVMEIGLWGAEPTINAKYFYSFLNQMFEIMPNLNRLMFSTNSYLGYNYIKIFIESVDKLSKKYNKNNFDLRIQFSLDGPAWINDPSRKIGATQRTINTIYSICDNFTDDFNGNLNLHFKPTLNLDYMKQMIENEELLNEYFNFFKEIKETAIKKIEGKNKIRLGLNGYPTLVLPGEYTSEDGKVYAKWIQSLNKTDIKHLQPFRNFDVLSNSVNNFELTDKVTCGAGHSSMVLNADGDIISCHQLARYSSYNNEKRQIPIIQAQSTLTGESTAKVEYNVNLIHYYEKNLFQYFEIMTIALAKSGQIESIYLTNQEARKFLYLFVTSSYCFASQGEKSQEPFIFIPSLIRLFGNGAAEMLLKYGINKNLFRYNGEIV